ncbi:MULTISPECIES: hypothetical protein [unclassified Streptomyces]|uniref:hypothetical protein n=1 Tax=unclassified Streptomyces TaxID=2593676 RepID=UPI0036B822EF
MSIFTASTEPVLALGLALSLGPVLGTRALPSSVGPPPLPSPAVQPVIREPVTVTASSAAVHAPRRVRTIFRMPTVPPVSYRRLCVHQFIGGHTRSFLIARVDWADRLSEMIGGE